MTTTGWLVLLAIPIGYLVVAGMLLGYHRECPPTRSTPDVAFWWLSWFDVEGFKNDFRADVAEWRAWAWPLLGMLLGFSLFVLICASMAKLTRLLGCAIVAIPLALGRLMGRRRPRVPRARALARQKQP